MPGAGACRGARRSLLTRMRSAHPRSITSRACCCAATASCSASCSSARAACRRGGSSSTCTGAWRRAARFAAGGSSADSPASSLRCRRRRILLQSVSRDESRGPRVDLGADPLNLVGIVTPGERVPAIVEQSRAVRAGRAGRRAGRRRGAVPERRAETIRSGRSAICWFGAKDRWCVSRHPTQRTE